ncbi:MAG TPA: cellulase family glycosylhydrolase [Anaerolineae bacterium]|nr:cellulase family glycosylhydrolase [Anaerolineae bacterium]
MKRLSLAFVTLSLMVGACAPETPPISPTPAPTLTATAWPRARLKSPEYAVQAFLWWKPEITRRDLTLIQEMGFTWIKQQFAWRDIEGAGKGRFEWSRADDIVRRVNNRKLKLLARIDRQPFWAQPAGTEPLENAPPANLQDFADFCYALADRYRGKIAAYQVWNEPNLAREWGDRPPDPKAYVELLKTCYVAIKRADPDALVISAGMAPTGTWTDEVMPDDMFIEQMYQAGAAPYFDMLGVHAPGYKAPPEASPDEVAASPELGGQRFFCFRRVEDLRALMIKYGDAGKQVAVLEMGWTTDRLHPEYAWHAVDEQTQADYLVRAFKFARENWSPWIGLMTVIAFADPFWTEDDEQYWWTIVYPDWPEIRVKPAYEALKAMPKE